MMHSAHQSIDPWARRVAVLVSILAASLALVQISSSSAQNSYLTHHIALSDGWAFYQSKNARAVSREVEISLLEETANPSDPRIQAKIATARAYIARMRDDAKGEDGMKQLMDKSKTLEHERDEAFHRYHNYEYSIGALEIAIVLASVSLVTGFRFLTYSAGVLGLGAIVFALCVAGDFF